MAKVTKVHDGTTKPIIETDTAVPGGHRLVVTGISGGGGGGGSTDPTAPNAVELSDGTAYYKGATETTLAAVLAKIITAPATEATLALIKAKTDNIDVALSTRTKPADQQHVVIDAISGTVSAVNSSVVALTSGSVFTGTSEDVSGYSSIVVNVIADQSGTLAPQFSSNGTNWDFAGSHAIAANVGQMLVFRPGTKFFRIVYTNGGTNQGSFRLQTLYHQGEVTLATVQSLGAGLANPTTFMVGANQMVQTGGGTTWAPAKADSSNRPTVSSDDGSLVSLGTTTDAGIITDIAGTVIGFLRGNIKMWLNFLARLPAALVGGRLDVNVGAATTLTANSTLQAGSATAGNVGGMEAFPTATFTRPADTTAYAANDAICNSTTVPAAMTFASAALRSGGGGFVIGATILDEANQTTKMNATLHLFSAVPGTLTNDNAQMAFANADLANWQGALRFTTTAVTNTASGASGSVMLFAPVGGSFPYKCAATSLFGVLQADNAYTPVSAEVFLVTLQLSQDA